MFQAEGASLDAGCVGVVVHGEACVGDGQAAGADEAALMAFDHRAVVGPGLKAEVAFEELGAGGAGVVHGVILEHLA